MNLADEIIKGLKREYGFKKTTGSWLQEGLCPQCGKKEVYTAAQDPKMVKCGRADNCGFEISVRDALPDLFDDWSKRFEATEKDPNAAADAYLQYERGLDLTGLRGHYSQEFRQDRGRNIGSATVRFPIADSWWERIIDRPGRFDRKAHFKFGGSWNGHCWQHPLDTIDDIAKCSEIWIEEGIFDAAASRQQFKRLERAGGRTRTAVSAMSCNTWPGVFLDQLREALGNSKHRPTIIFAYDQGPAGVRYTRKHVARARREGWAAEAAQTQPDGEGNKQDWNDLHLRQIDWNGDEDRAPFSEQSLETYIYNGKITIATSAYEKAKLIHARSMRRSFYFRFEGRIYWVKVRSRNADDEEKADDGPNLMLEEIANCDFRILYRERDEVEDETNYFIETRFPNNTPTAKARFSASCCAASGEFKKRLFAFSGMWKGNQEQLDRLMSDQTRTLKTVEPIHFTGYSKAHDAWVLGDIAVHQGRTLNLSSERYFDIGRSAVKLRSEQRLLDVQYDSDKLDLTWAPLLHAAWGPRGVATLAFFTLSLFAVQIRAKNSSLGFLEIFGEAGSGKTTLIAFMWKLLGRIDSYEGFDPSKATNAAIARTFMQVSGMPVGLIESRRDDSKPTHSRQFDYSELLTLFNGRSPRTTGRKNHGTDTFEPPFLGSIYLMQNEPVDGMQAVLERIMSFKVDKSLWSDGTRDAARTIEAWDRDDASGWIVHVCRKAKDYLPFYFDRVAHHRKTMRGRVPDLNNDRIILNHSQLAAGVEALALLLPKQLMKPAWITETLAFIDRIALERQQSSGGDHPIVQRFWDIVDDLIAREAGDAHEVGASINQHRKPDQYYAIHLTSFERMARQAGLIPPDYHELKRHLRGSKARKYLGDKSVNPPKGAQKHCWVFKNPAYDSSGGSDVII